MRSVLKNIDCVLTGAKKIIVLSSSIIVLSLLNIMLSSYSDFASALTYSNPGQVSFTFNPTLSLSLSSSNIVISNLSPNTTSDSNIVIINISTNIAYGYALTASVGNAGNATTNLTNTANSSNTFTSLATTDSLASMNSADASSNGKWGYSFSTDSGTTWSNYSGLPLYTDTANYAELINTTSAADSRLISFKIGAKSSNLQASGTYTNTINFYLTSNPVPVNLETAYEMNGKTRLNGYYKLQDMDSTICGTAEVYDGSGKMQVIDTRDNQIYWIAKLQDDNCWMLENLRLDPTDSTTAANMSASNTNAPATAITNYLNGGNNGNVAGWSNVAVVNVNSELASYTAPMINNESKDTLVTGFGPASINNQAKVGIYYNYCAATVGTYCYDNESGTGNASYDVCPANWRIPTAASDFGNLLAVYNTTLEATNPASPQYNLSIALSGNYYYQSSGQDSYGDYWSSTFFDSSMMYFSEVYESYFGANFNNSRDRKFSIRCISQ